MSSILKVSLPLHFPTKRNCAKPCGCAVLLRASPFLLLAHQLRAAARHYHSGCPSLSTLISPARGSVVAWPLLCKNVQRCPPTRTAASAPPRCSALLGCHSRSPRVVCFFRSALERHREDWSRGHATALPRAGLMRVEREGHQE